MPATGRTAPTDAPVVRFGVLGAGSRIARWAVMPAIVATEGCALVAAGSDGRAADAFDRAPEMRTYDSYDAVIDDPDVDVVYIPLPNHLHLPWGVRAAEAGKHVLCEKPLAPSLHEAEQLVDACESAGVLLLEAWMTPFLPRNEAILSMLRDGGLGRVVSAHSTFTYPCAPGDHRFSVQMGGGGLLDVGVYCIEPLLAAARGADPIALTASQVLGGDGVDVSFTGSLDFGSFVGTFATSMDAPFTQTLEVHGTDGSVRVSPFHIGLRDSDRYTIVRRDGSTEVVETGPGNAYEGMVAHTRDLVRCGATTSPVRPPDDTLRLLHLEEQLRAAAVTHR